jgi:hypothetical protein
MEGQRNKIRENRDRETCYGGGTEKHEKGMEGQSNMLRERRDKETW